MPTTPDQSQKATTSSAKLWEPSVEQIAANNFTHFIQYVNGSARSHDNKLEGFWDTHAWSVDDLDGFWSSAWDFLKVKGHKGDVAYQAGKRMQDAKFFPDAKLNFAENFLRRSDNGDAIVFWAEAKVKRTLSWADLNKLVSQIQQVMKSYGLKPGDRVAAILPNVPEAVAIMLAASGLGLVISTASPDFGIQGVLDRFGQIDPKLLFVTDGYWYNGKHMDVGQKMADVASQLPSLQDVFLVPLSNASEKPFGKNLPESLKNIAPTDIHFEQLPFDHPLYILFSSGTTGVPKCIVHRAGGSLIQHMKEHQLHCNIKPDDRVFFFTTTGWMMWNWLVTVLASEATILLYDGSPFATPTIVFDFVEQEKATLLGTSAKYIDAIGKAGLKPKDTHDLSNLRSILSTGSTLVHEGFDYVYENVKADVHLASVSGGTDICACFVGANPIGPVYRGEIQAPVLGMATESFDEQGKPVIGVKGELVCVKPFPSMPLTFWGEGGDEKYHKAYFAGFPNVWTHGDFVQIGAETGGFTFFGRSDATLNPQGVRIGTSEIYRQVEQLPQILESIVIGQDWDKDTRVVLFVKLATGHTLNEKLTADIKSKIRTGASPRHVPAVILTVEDIPRTKSGKIVELAVREVVHGRSVKNIEALANPEALNHFKDRAELS